MHDIPEEIPPSSMSLRSIMCVIFSEKFIHANLYIHRLRKFDDFSISFFFFYILQFIASLLSWTRKIDYAETNDILRTCVIRVKFKENLGERCFLFSFYFQRFLRAIWSVLATS